MTYTENSKFTVEIGKNKSKYSFRYTFTGDYHRAVFYYDSINLGKGYKKRLRVDGKTLVKAFS